MNLWLILFGLAAVFGTGQKLTEYAPGPCPSPTPRPAGTPCVVIFRDRETTVIENRTAQTIYFGPMGIGDRPNDGLSLLPEQRIRIGSEWVGSVATFSTPVEVRSLVVCEDGQVR